MVQNRIYLGLISNRWTQEIMAALSEQPRCFTFTELLHGISPPPSSRMLAASLARLQDHGLVRHRPAEDAPYELTAAGDALLQLVSGFQEELWRWQEEHGLATGDADRLLG